jgi:MFS family permease
MAALSLEGTRKPQLSNIAMATEGKWRTTVLINLASILEKCDEQILPALYSRVGASFQATPAQLGNITLARALAQALSSPLAGVASNFAPRGRVIGAGCLLWAAFTALFACTSSLAAALPLVAVNGVGLALVIPSVQSLTADLTPPEARGRAFGRLWLTISCGGMLGALFATNVGAYRPLGVEGWRFAFVTVSLLSAATGLLNAALVVDPTYQPHSGQAAAAAQGARARAGSPGGGGATSPAPAARAAPRLDLAMLRSVADDIGAVLRIPTFSIIIVQGIVGSVPYASLVFLTLYLQLLGMSDAAASGLVALYLVGGGLGGLLGGWIGDAAAARWPNHGRIAATQLSVASGVPFALLIFRVSSLASNCLTLCVPHRGSPWRSPTDAALAWGRRACLWTAPPRRWASTPPPSWPSRRPPPGPPPAATTPSLPRWCPPACATSCTPSTAASRARWRRLPRRWWACSRSGCSASAGRPR